LGADPKRYERYAKAIREEYAFVPEPDYRVARVKVLRSFLDRERIYLTDRMYAVGEEFARQNILAEISILGGEIPS
jgi:predicted metal-dependent HD superfamily phosphohydrolase